MLMFYHLSSGWYISLNNLVICGVYYYSHDAFDFFYCIIFFNI